MLEFCALEALKLVDATCADYVKVAISKKWTEKRFLLLFRVRCLILISRLVWFVIHLIVNLVSLYTLTLKKSINPLIGRLRPDTMDATIP